MQNIKTDKPLSVKHKRFVRLVRSGRSATSAYAAAYNVPNSKATRAASCRLMKDARIIAAINKGRPTPAAEARQTAATAQGKASIPANNPVNISEPPKKPASVEAIPNPAERPDASEIERKIREQIGEPPPQAVNRFTLPLPQYHRPPAPTLPSEQEALRRRLRSQRINDFGFMNNE